MQLGARGVGGAVWHSPPGSQVGFRQGWLPLGPAQRQEGPLAGAGGSAAMATLARLKGPIVVLSPQIFQINIPNSSQNCCCVNIFTASFVYFPASRGGEKKSPWRSRGLASGAPGRPRPAPGVSPRWYRRQEPSSPSFPPSFASMACPSPNKADFST